jgi:hypothetical protein
VGYLESDVKVILIAKEFAAVVGRLEERTA